jgi:IclR family transcriptional regulator, KDG regulon repressor
VAESVKSTERALRVIELLTGEASLDFSAICAQLTLPKSSAHALLATMRDMGFIHFDEVTRRYSLGPRLWEAGQAYIEKLDIARLADPYMRRVRDQLGETVQLAILDGIENVYVGKMESAHALQLVSRLGSRLPAYTTGLGKTLLAALPDAEVLRRLGGIDMKRFTARTITDPGRLLAELEKIRRRGYATDTGEYTEGVYCLAFPIKAPTGTVAAMSVSIPEVRVTAEVRRHAAAVMIAETGALSRQLGASDAAANPAAMAASL